MKLRVLTPTKDRPEAMHCLSHWLRAQTFQEFEWWIVHDGDRKALRIPHWWQDRLKYLHREPGPELQSLNANLIHALNEMPGDLPIAIVEDDDYYAPTYLETMMKGLGTGAAVVGLAPALYYNIKVRAAKNCGNQNHASLSTTVVAPHALKYLRAACEAPPQTEKQREHWSKFGAVPFVDIRLWRSVGGKIISTIQGKRPLHVGIKGMPGTAGIGVGHRISGSNDKDLSMFKAWLGEDWVAYEEYLDAPGSV